MKNLMITATLTMLTSLAYSQNNPVTSGKITYEEKIKIEIKIQGDTPGLANLPKERKAEKVLTFSGDAMLFEDGNSNVENEMASHNADGNMRIRMVMSGENKIYTDLKAKKVIEQRDFMNRIFLVEKDMKESEWKISGNQREIMGYKCIEAYKTDTAGNKTVAWFTPSINVEGGPAGLGNLPGMILEAEMNNGSRVYVAKNIESLPSSDVRIQRPKEGKQVTEEEYRKIVTEKLKEMGAEEGSGGNQVRIVIKHQ